MQSTENTGETRLDIDAIQARAEAAAPAPWFVNIMGELRAPSPYNGIMLSRAWSSGPDGPEARFIAHARDDVPALLSALATERDRADRWAAQVAAIEEVLDDHAFDDEDGNGFVPIGPLQDALFGKKMPA